MTKLTDEDIMGVINNQRILDNFLSYVMIGSWVICIGFCIFETVVRILMIIRKRKNLKAVDNVSSEPMNNESSIITKNESDSSSLEPILPWLGDLIILLLSSAIGIAGILIVINNNQPVSFRIEEKYVAQADVYYFENKITDNNHNDKNDWNIKIPKEPDVYYFVFVCENNNSLENIKKYKVDATTYSRFTENFEVAYIAINNNNQSVISAWNKSEYLYVGKFLIP